MFVKWDGEKIIAGPQGAPAGEGWLPYIKAENKQPRQPCTFRYSEELGAVIQELGEEFTPNWREQRSEGYGRLTDQLDKMFHDITNGTLTTDGEWYQSIQAVKDAIPKPEETDGD